MALTPRQERFVAEYLADLNASAAYRRAGYTAKDANVAGPRLLAKVSIQQAIQAAREKQMARLIGLRTHRI